MSGINRDLDRYLRKRSEGRKPYAGPSWFEKMFTSAEKDEQVTPEQEEKIPTMINKVIDREGRTALLFESEWDLGYFQKNNPDITLLDAPLPVH